MSNSCDYISVEERQKRQAILKAVLHYFYQDNTHAGAHSKYNLKYHFVWIPKYRRSFLTGEIAERLREIILETANQYGFIVIAQEIMPDHVHLLIESPPKYAPSEIAQIFKSISARKLRQEFLDIIKRYIWKDGALWASGYYVASVGDIITTEIVKEYIENQKFKPEEDKGKPAETTKVAEVIQLQLL